MVSEQPVATGLSDNDKKKKRGGGVGDDKEKTERKGTVLPIYCMTVQITSF